jgi:peptidoglycan biosynthesis protein MviN/MurJ (putative lipid II flippase)
MATFMKEGSVAIFNFSLNLQGVPLTIIGVSYSIAAFPALARYFSEGQREKYLRHSILSRCI